MSGVIVLLLKLRFRLRREIKRVREELDMTIRELDQLRNETHANADNPNIFIAAAQLAPSPPPHPFLPDANSTEQELEEVVVVK